MEDFFKDILTWVFILSFAIPALRRLFSPRRARSSTAPDPTYEETYEAPMHEQPPIYAPTQEPQQPAYDVVKALEGEKKALRRQKLIPIPQPNPTEEPEYEEDNEWVGALRNPESAKQTLILGEILKPKF